MADRRRLTPQQQDRHDRIVHDYALRFRRSLRGRRWAARFVARRGWK